MDKITDPGMRELAAACLLDEEEKKVLESGSDDGSLSISSKSLSVLDEDKDEQVSVSKKFENLESLVLTILQENRELK